MTIILHNPISKLFRWTNFIFNTYIHQRTITIEKQFVQEVTVTNDGGVPIGTQSLDGNSADVSNYISAWKKIKEEIGTTDFVTIGDCKLSSDENLLTIMKSKGYFIAPLAMYSN